MGNPNNQDRGGRQQPPSVISAQPAAPKVEPVSAVVAAEPADKPLVEGSVSIADVAETMGRFVAATSDATVDAPAPKYVAAVRHFVGGAKGHIEPGEAIEPSAEDLPVMLAQQTIREA